MFFNIKQGGIVFPNKSEKAKYRSVLSGLFEIDTLGSVLPDKIRTFHPKDKKLASGKSGTEIKQNAFTGVREISNHAGC